MKTKALVLTFAVCAVCTGSLVAQQTPSQELAPIVAVEEQERDLAKAERLYKEAIDGGKLSVAAKEMATLRLVELLMKLGKRDEAKQWMGKLPLVAFDNAGFDDFTSAAPQDRERQEALRTKARELVQKAMAQSVPRFPGETGIFDEELRRQIEWLGDAVVPEIAASLAAAKPTFAGKTASDLSPSTAKGEALCGLAGVLWRLGSPAARAQLEEAYRNGSEAFRALLVTQAARHAPALRELVVKWLHEDPSEAVFWQLANSGNGNVAPAGWVEGRNNWAELSPEVLLGAAAHRSPAMRARVLRWLPVRPPSSNGVWVAWSSAAASRACGMVRELANGTDPEVVRTALAALANPRLQLTPEGFECLVDHLGRMGDDVPLNWVGVPREWRKDGDENLFAKEVVLRLWPKLVAVALGGLPKGFKQWVSQSLAACGPSLDGAMLDDLIALQSRGYGGLLRDLHGRLDQSQALRLVQAFAQMDEAKFDDGARGLFDNELPPEALPLLVGKTEMAVRLQKVDWLAKLVAQTGNPDAVPWLLAQADRSKDRSTLPDLLLQLGRRTQAEPVRAAMREWASTRGLRTMEVLLALLSMHDADTLATLRNSNVLSLAAKHPYAKAKDGKAMSPLAYVLMDEPDPPHGFSQEERLAFAQGADAWGAVIAQDDAVVLERVPTSILMVLAERSTLRVGVVSVRLGGGTQFRSSSWQEEIAARIEREDDLQGPLHRWLLGVLTKPGPALRVVDYLGERDRAAVRPLLERALAGDDAEMAAFAFESLRNEQPPLDCEALTNSKHRAIVERAANLGMNRGSLSVATALRLLPTYSDPNEIAYYFGEKVAVETVPALLQLLQHENSGVRSAAKDALTKIRFVHEQKSYWDRITKGLDASPTAAVEKLLLQAKPGAPTEQRLLAITSLGTLGVPEALPFLIEWTQDADANIAKAAKDAITQIHLNPRR